MKLIIVYNSRDRSPTYTVSQKLCQLIFCSLFIKYEPISIWEPCYRRENRAMPL